MSFTKLLLSPRYKKDFFKIEFSKKIFSEADPEKQATFKK